jgi:amicyanin
MSPMAGMSSASAAAGAAAAPVATTHVTIAGFAFSPQVVTVKVGTTVTWTNQDGEPHTVTAATGSGGPSSAPLQQGDTYRYTFATAGRFAYLCTIHPFMTGTVVVTR